MADAQYRDIHFTKLAQFQPKQLEAWHILKRPNVTYLLYGGALHGGKSYFLRWAALGLALQFGAALGKPGVAIGLFSEDYPTLRDRQISKIKQEFPTEIGELKSTQEEGFCFFIHPEFGGGRILLRNLDDPSKYMSSEFAAILVEELTKNSLQTFTDLRMRLRWPGIDCVKFVGATNPGGIGHMWCKQYWIDRNSGDLEQSQFAYLPATLNDNKYTTPQYRKKLESLPVRLRRAYLGGDWTAFEGMFFTTFEPSQVIEPFVIDPEWELVGSLDPGWGGTCSFGLQARDFSGVEYRIATYTATERGPADNAVGINEFIKLCKFTAGRKPNVIVAGHDAWAQKDRFSIYASDKTMADVFRAHDLFLSPAQLDRPNGWGALKAAMPNQYKIFDHYNVDLVNQLSSTLTDENHVYDIQGCGRDPKVQDHALDEARYGHMALWLPAKKLDKQKPPSSVAEFMDRIATPQPRRLHADQL